MKSKASLLWSVLLAASLLLPAGVVTLAQDATPEATPETSGEIVETPIGDLSYNSPVVGHVSDSQITETWPLQVASPDRISVRVERLNGNLLPTVVIQDSNGTEVANSFGPDETGAVALIDGHTLAAAGQYSVVVSRDDGETGLTQGQYRLIVIPEATGAENINNTTVIGPVEAGTPLEGEITSTHWYHRYRYTAPADDTIRIVAERTGGSLQPHVVLLDANGQSLTTAYVENTGDHASLDSYTLPSAGDYIIAVSRYSEFGGETTGSYRLTLDIIGSGEGSPNLAGLAGDVTYDTLLEGQITGPRWYEDWRLTAQAGDTLTITIRRRADSTGGNLQPEVALLGGSGQELNRGYLERTGDMAMLDRYELPGPGTYTVRATRYGGQTAPTTGTYELMVNLVGSGEGNPNLEGATGTVEVGQTVQGEVTNARWADSWTLQGQADQTIRVVVQRTGGTLIPMVELRDVNGQSFTTAYPEATRDSATLEYRLPAAAQFQVVVLREQGQRGVTTGTYSAKVTQGGQ